jgi:hypothetical protein
MKKTYFLMGVAISVIVTLQSSAQLVATLEELPLESESYWNGDSESGGFVSSFTNFRNQYNKDYFSWSGFAYSNITNNTIGGYMNQYSAFPGKGALESMNYAIGYNFGADTVALDKETEMFGMYVANSTYAAIAMKEGDDYSKKFGGTTGNDEDWFKLTIKGWKNPDLLKGTVEFYLADFRFADNSKDYINGDWQWVDLSSLKEISYLTFELSSTDNGDWGMNTPAYFCLDQITKKEFTQIKFIAENRNQKVENVAITFNSEILTTDINGEVVFENVSPTLQMDVKATKEGFAEFYQTINGYFTNTMILNLTVNGIKNNQTSNLFSVYPNPVKKQLTILGTDLISSIIITNYFGQQILVIEGNQSFNQTIDLENIEKGAYILKVDSGNQIQIIKFIKQ